MQNDAIFKEQLIGEQGRLVCVMNVGILRDTPGFVTDDPLTVIAG